MLLFSKEKEIIFKITNAILLIWLIAAIVFVASSIIGLTLKEPVREYTLAEYKASNCLYKDETLSDEEYAGVCLNQYNDYEFNTKNADYYKWQTLYISIANVVIVGGVLFFLNKPKKIKK